MPASKSIRIRLTCDFCGNVRDGLPGGFIDDHWFIISDVCDRTIEFSAYNRVMCPQCSLRTDEFNRIRRYKREHNPAMEHDVYIRQGRIWTNMYKIEDGVDPKIAEIQDAEVEYPESVFDPTVCFVPGVGGKRVRGWWL